MKPARLFRPWRAVSLQLQRSSLGMVPVRQRMFRVDADAPRWFEGDESLWSSGGAERAGNLVAEALSQLPSGRRTGIAVQVALPDPVVATCALDAREWPRRRTERRRFAEWLVRDRFGFSPDDHVVTWAACRHSGPGCRVLAYAAPRAVVEATEAAIWRAGMGVALIDAAAHFRARYWRRARGRLGGAVHADGEYLGLVAWDARGAPLLMRGRWHAPGAGDPAAIADEIERALRLNPELADRAATAPLVVTGARRLTEALQPILEERLGRMFVPERAARAAVGGPEAIGNGGNPEMAAACR